MPKSRLGFGRQLSAYNAYSKVLLVRCCVTQKLGKLDLKLDLNLAPDGQFFLGGTKILVDV